MKLAFTRFKSYLNLIASFFFIILCLNGCSVFKQDFEPFTSQIPVASRVEPKPISNNPVEVSIESLPSRNLALQDSIEIRWLIPEEDVDGYVIRYGFSPTALEYEERLAISNIKIENSVQHGKVLVYDLKGLPKDKIVYLSIAAQREEKLSKASAIFSVHPLSAN